MNYDSDMLQKNHNQQNIGENCDFFMIKIKVMNYQLKIFKSINMSVLLKYTFMYKKNNTLLTYK